ncbi:MAG: DUF4143 domain-containing protein [Spirochaetales bacterium]|nr:DUF4143 domain-containing protein [Spirochaetales bacterium]
MKGNILEGFIISEFLKQKLSHNLQIEPYFYRDSNGNEVDLVLDFGFKQNLYEIKAAKSIQRKHYSRLEKIGSLFSNPELFLISGREERQKLSRTVMNIPLWDVNYSIL